MSARYQPCIRRKHQTRSRRQQITTTRRRRARQHQGGRRQTPFIGERLQPLILVSLGLLLLSGSGQAFEQYSGWTQTSRQTNDGPVETTFSGLGERDGFIGCLQEPTLCNDEEICYDDSLFGRCSSADYDENDYANNPPPVLTPAVANLLQLEIEQLGEAGFDWSHPYTQCVLQNTISAIQQDLPFDEADCDMFLPDTNRVGDQDIVIVPEDLITAAGSQDEGGGGGGEVQQLEELPEVVYVSDDDDEASVVPKKTPAAPMQPIAASEDDDDDDNTGFFDSWRLPDGNGVIEVDEQPDGGLLIQSQGVGDDDLLTDFASRVTDISEREGTNDLDDVIPILQQENPGLVVYEVIDDDGAEDELDDVDDEPTIEDFRAVEDFVHRATEELEQEVEEQHRRNDDYLMTRDINDDDYFGGDDDIQRIPRLEKRGGGGGLYPNPFLRPNILNDQDEEDIYFQEPIQIGSEPEEFFLPVADGESELFEAPLISEEEHRQPQLGLGSYIFNRRGRLDVKKPGPFYAKSPNNFFLDKLMSSGGDYDYNSDGGSSDLSRNDTGQVEYEMPLVAPPPSSASSLEENGNDVFRPRDKIGNLVVAAEESPELSEANAPTNSYVHIATKRRLNTWKQGSDFIERLAHEFGLPEGALTDRMIERQHVQFHVSANPNRVDAHQMAKRIDEDSKLRERIDHQLGVEIDKAAAGHKDDVERVLYAPGVMANFNLVLLLVVCVSSAAAVFVVATVLLLVKKRRARVGRLSDKVGRADEDELEKARAQEEYKQLCRDWSKSGKKVDQPSRNRSKPPLKGCDSGNSNGGDRSSTSSEEVLPNTTNMDISTGHMVLAYMEDHLKNKQRLEQEWVGLCGYEAEPCATTVAFKAENKKKNRYPDKLPYDHNRVILNLMANANNSDYVNASTVTDHDPRNPSYIVTQAPMANTVADFWQMIWEQGCVVIVILTRLQDNGLQLCQRYWPEEGSEQYHIFEVHLVSEHVWCDDYLVRSVYLKNTRSGETRTVTQFHFRSWPSHGVPTSTKALLEFRRKVNKSYRGRSCPIAVHCSDGVGRSGTYVLIDMVLNRMAKGCKEIDIAATLEHIRDQRGGMVQSRPQFEFCLMAVAEEVHAILKALPQ